MAEENQDTDAAMDTSGSNCVLDMMKKEIHTAQQSAVIASLSSTLQRSSIQTIRYLEATAELCRRGQEDMLNHLVDYVKSMTSYIHPLCFVWHENLDETPLRLRVPFSDTDAPGGVSQLAKVYVRENHWSMVLKTSHMDHSSTASSVSTSSGSEQPQSDPARFLLIRGAFSPSMVAAERSTATAIAAVMLRTPQPPAVIDEIFEHKLRLAERDEAPANIKAERLHGNTLNGWTSMAWHCTAHKVHSIADKVLGLDKDTVSGVVNTLLCMQATQHLEQLQEALVRVAQSSLIVVPLQDLPPDVALYRKKCAYSVCTG